MKISGAIFKCLEVFEKLSQKSVIASGSNLLKVEQFFLQ